MPKTAANIYAEAKKLEEQAAQMRREFCEALMDSVPENLQEFFDSQYWFRRPVGETWAVEQVIDRLLNYPGATSLDIYDRSLRNVGFDSIEAFRRAFRPLRKAWRGILKIRIEQYEMSACSGQNYEIQVWIDLHPSQRGDANEPV